MANNTTNYSLKLNEGTDDVVDALVVNQNLTMNVIDSTMKINANGVSQALTPIEPTAVISQLITIMTPNTTDKKFTLDIKTTVTGGDITIARNNEPAKDLLNPDGTNVTELSQDGRFFDVYEDVSAFYLAPKGADEWGGLKFIIDETFGRLFYCDDGDDTIYELDVNTRLAVNAVPSVALNPYGIGGTENRLYHCLIGAALLYELDVNTLLPISSAARPGSNSRGMGGIASRLYHTDLTTVLIYELDPDTKLQISSAAAPASNPAGVGGISDPTDRLYHADYNTGLMYELDPDTKLQISSAAGMGASLAGAGGIGTRLYSANYDTDLLFEVDPDTKLQIASSSSLSFTPRDIGGVKGSGSVVGIQITKVEFNGTEYELTDDSCFRVSGGVV